MKTTLGRLLYRLASPSMRALANRRLRASYDLNKGPPMAVEKVVDSASLDRSGITSPKSGAGWATASPCGRC